VPDARRLFGDRGEAARGGELARRGVRTVARSARTRYGQIDLIGRDDRGHVFIEVKTRRRGSFASAAGAVDRRTLARLQGLGLGRANQHRIRRGTRLMVAAVTVDGAGMSVERVEVSE
jgi:putative endonuclease